MFDAGEVSGEAAVALERARRRVAAVNAEAYRLLEDLAELDRLGVATETGNRSTARLVAEVARVSQGEATRLCAEAADLVPQVSLLGEPLPPRYPTTARVYGSGEIGPGHVAIIRRTLRRLERVPDVAAEDVVWAEEYLASQATLFGPRRLQQLADELLARLDPDGQAPSDEEDRWDELLLTARRDGTLTLRGAFKDAADVALLRSGFAAGSTPAGPDDTRSIGQRRAAALTEFVGAALGPHGILTDHPDDETTDEPADDAGEAEDGEAEDGEAEDGEAEDAEAEDAELALLPQPRRAEPAAPRRAPAASAGRALLTITIDHRWLRRAIGHGTLDDAALANIHTVRRWACDAEIIPMVLGTRSEPLDVGRLARTVPDAIRRALNTRDRGCAFPDCPRTPPRCHAHHVRHWTDGGATCLANLVLLCRHHHQQVHHGLWTIEMIDGRPWFRPPPWVDPDQRPRPGGRPLVPT